MKVIVEDECAACDGRGKVPYAEARARNIMGAPLTEGGPVICFACTGKGGRQRAIPLEEFAKLLTRVVIVAASANGGEE